MFSRNFYQLYLQFIMTFPFVLSSFVVRAQLDDVAGTQEKQILDTILNERYYDKNFRPGRSNLTGPTVVNINMTIHRITKLDDMNMEMQMLFTMRQEWVDERLRFAHLNANMEQLLSPYLATQKIWIPDIYFKDEVQSTPHVFIGPNSHVRIFSDGTVVYTSRIIGSFYCPLNLKDFPHDSHNCFLKMASYAYTKDELVFNWTETSQIILPDDLNIPKFKLLLIETGYCSSDERSCIEAVFGFEREFNHFLIHVYIPCTMLIIISFLSLCLDPLKMAIPRIFISLITLALGVIMVFILNANLPPVPYTKNIDIWTGVTLTFLFVPVAEFIVINSICKGRLRKVSTKNNADKEDNLNDLPTVLKQFNRNNSIFQLDDTHPDFTYVDNKCATATDCIVRILFPLLFILFVVIYWLIIVNGAV